MRPVPVDYDVLTDRVQMLEEVIRLLLRHMMAQHVITPELQEALVDSLIDTSTGDPRAKAQADRWQKALEGKARP